jgi:hypothetical protein
MHPDLKQELAEAGEDLRASHDDEVIEDVIADIEDLDDDSSEVTGKILREMTEIEAE